MAIAPRRSSKMDKSVFAWTHTYKHTLFLLPFPVPGSRLAMDGARSERQECYLQAGNSACNFAWWQGSNGQERRRWEYRRNLWSCCFRQRSVHYDVSDPTTDKNGTEHFNVSSTGLNGLASLPFAPKDTIKTSINFSVTSDGKVGIDGGMRTAYPSIEVYSYGSDGSTHTLLQRTESGHLSDLQRQDQVIPAVSPE